MMGEKVIAKAVFPETRPDAELKVKGEVRRLPRAQIGGGADDRRARSPRDVAPRHGLSSLLYLVVVVRKS